MSDWIKCSERTPIELVGVLAFDGKQMSVAHLHAGEWIDGEGVMFPLPTHWQPLPEPPKDL